MHSYVQIIIYVWSNSLLTSRNHKLILNKKNIGNMVLSFDNVVFVVVI